MAKATEIRFSVPTASAAKPVVSSRPSSSVSAIGTVSRHERTAANSQTQTSRKLPPRPIAAPWATEENSSSSSATEPVTRTRACPSRTKSRLAAARRSATVAKPPGCNEP